MSREKLLTPEKIIKGLIVHKGLIYKTAEYLGCSAKTIYNYMREYPEIKEVVDEQRQLLVDTAEASLLRAIQEGEGWAVALALKTLGKDRGYVERQEITGKDGSDLVKDTIKVKWENDVRDNPT